MAALDQYLNQSNANQQQYRQQGDQLQDYSRRRADSYYNPLEEQYRQQGDEAFGQLRDTPGFTGDEATGIMGNPNAGFGYYNPDDLTGDMERGNSEVGNAATSYGGGLRDASARTASGLRGAAGNYGHGVETAAAAAKGDLNAPVDSQLDWQGGVYNYLRDQNEGALGDFGSALDSSTDPSKLGLSSDFKSQYEMSPEEEQGIKNVAAQSTSGQYRKMAAEAKLRAAAQGNTSPAALAAIEEQLGQTGAAEAGDAATRAAVAASAEKAGRVRDYEGMRLGTEQDISGRRSANAGNVYQARAGGAQNLAGLEQQGIQSATGNRLQGAAHAADLGYNAADTAGQAGYNAEAGAANADMAAADKGGTANMGAAQFGATNRQNVATGNQQTGQQLAIGADAARSNRTAGVAGQRITGQNTYRNYLTGQQGMQQQGGEDAGSQAIKAYGTEGGLQNQATGQGMQAAQAKDNKPGLFDKILGSAGGIMSGVGSLATAFERGGVVNKPTLAMVGERGPEMVVKVGGDFNGSGYSDGPGRRFGRYGMAA